METTVLVVEDEPAIVELVSYSLREAGWNIQSVASAGAAWAALCNKRPQLMLLDWMLPDRAACACCRACGPTAISPISR